MIDELEVGEYIRTEAGIIDQIACIKDTFIGGRRIEFEQEGFNYSEFELEKVIAKHSKSILDLIEVGDILKIEEGNEIYYIGFKQDTDTLTYQEIIDSIKNKKIKLLEILTHKRYEKDSYKMRGN